METTWTVKSIDRRIVDSFSQVFNYDRYISSLLCAKGIHTLEDAHLFSNKRLSNLLSPFLMKGMYDAVKRIRSALDHKDKIGIFSDSDLDGLTSLTIVINLFEKLNMELFFRYPVHDEDYGLTIKVIEEMKEKGVRLILTFDSGIRDIKEIGYARELGIDVIVCDHHQPADKTPDAIIVNPKQDGCGYPYKELAGVGVALKLCHGVLMSFLPGFNKPFFIITEDRGFWISKVVNGIIEEVWNFNSLSDLFDLIEKIGENANIMLYDLGKVSNEVKDIFQKYPVYDLVHLAEEVMDIGHMQVEKKHERLCAAYNIRDNIFDISLLSSIDFL